jgi:hypothetical protein
MPTGLTAAEEANVLGGATAMWGETMVGTSRHGFAVGVAYHVAHPFLFAVAHYALYTMHHTLCTMHYHTTHHTPCTHSLIHLRLMRICIRDFCLRAGRF